MFPLLPMPASLLLAALLPSLGQEGAPAPDRTLPPAGANTLATVQGRGVQVYRCSLQNEKLGWVLQAPDAVLVRPADGVQVGTHSAGPSWHWNDGSAIAGNVVANTPSQGEGNVPSLLLETFPTGNTRGFLSGVIWVRRAGTQGGVAPATGCDSAHLDATVRVPYTATYTFFTGALRSGSPSNP